MDFKNVLVGLGIPDTGRVFMAEFFDSFICVNRPMKSVYIRPDGKGPIDHIRNALVDVAKKLGCTHLWMADTDQVYPQDTLIKLLSHDLDVVAAKVHRRYPPYDPLLLRGEIHNYKTVPEDEWKQGGLIEVDATGCGSILYKMEVFKKIEHPWFQFKLEDPDPIGEDVFFCSKLKEAGYGIFVDCDIRVGHMGLNIITEESYWAYKWSQPSGVAIPQAKALPKKKDPKIKVNWEVENENSQEQSNQNEANARNN